MQLQSWWSSTKKFLSNNSIYLFHAYLFAFIAALAAVWLILQNSMAKEVVFVLNALVVMFVYAAVFSLFIFVLEYLHSVKKMRKNVFQDRVILFLFAIVNIFLTASIWYLIFWNLPEKITELELKTRFHESLEGLNITGYNQFHSTNFDVWLRTNQKIELELSRVKNNSFYSNEQFYLRRVGSVEFFTHNCHNDLDMANKELVKLLFGKEIQNPSELINDFSQSTGFEVMKRLKYFQQFDSVSLDSTSSRCSKVSINDFHTRAHAYGPAYVSYLNKDVAVIEFTDGDLWKLTVLNTANLYPIASYESKKGKPEVFISTANENIFIVNQSEETITSLHIGTGQVLTYIIPKNVNFYALGLVSRSGYLLGNLNGQMVIIGPRYSVSRKTTILDRLRSL